MLVPDLPNLRVAPSARRADFHLATVKDCTADFHSLSTSWRGVGLGFAPSNDNERISTPRPWGIAAKFVPKSTKGFRSPTGATLIHPLSAHRIICGLPSGSGETRRLATPKPSAAVSRLSKLAEKLSRSVFRLRRASRPCVDIAPAGRGGQSAAPCGHFASLVRSTFGLRGFPPLRYGASRWWWARGGDAEAIVKLCTRVVVPLLPRPRATASRRPLATAFGGDLRSGHNFGLAFGEVSLARPLAALRVRASRSGNPTPTARANLARRISPRRDAIRVRFRGVGAEPHTPTCSTRPKPPAAKADDRAG